VKRRQFVGSALRAASAVACSPLLGRAANLLARAEATRPQVALTMDDPHMDLGRKMRWPEANSRILKALASRNVQAALFVCGMRVDDAEGAKLLAEWDRAGHLIANHSYSHLTYNNERTGYAEFAVDFLKNERIIAPYGNRRPLFRYPFLKEGDTAEKRDKFRSLLRERAYGVGHVTIDASDWYVNERLMNRWEKDGKASLDPYRDYLIVHLLDRATFYRQLALDAVGREIRHTLLVHYSTLNALVLPEVMAAFEAAGWQWIDASTAYQDEVFKRQPKTLPAGESLVWALAKESGKFEARLRYPGEDDTYERPKMDASGL
jgi:peptidoglycan-N-acetylglucosamine deacetylase